MANLLLLATSMALSLGAAEAYLRFFNPQPLSAFYRWSDGTIRHRPSFRFRYARAEFSNVISYNSDGMRGPEIAEHKRPGVPRVLVMGDSFVDAKQVTDDEMLTSVMAEVSRAGGTPLEVINAGVSGYGTDRELILWERFGRGLRPDLVVLGFYPNDVQNNADRGLFGLDGDRAVALEEPGRPGRSWRTRNREFLAAHSHLYILIRLGLKEIDRVREEEQSRESEEVFARSPSERIATGWTLTLALLDEMRRRVEAEGARFVVVVFPARYQVDDALWEAQAKHLGLDPLAFDLKKSQRLLKEWAEKSGAPLIDLLDEFRSRNVSNSFYFSTDGHWNRDGHRLAAELILEGLIAQGLLTPDASVNAP